MTYAEMVAKAEQAHSKARTPNDKFYAYLNTMQFLFHEADNGAGIWLFFSFDNSVIRPSGENTRMDYKTWKTLRSQVAAISSEMGWIQAGNSYRV